MYLFLHKLTQKCPERRIFIQRSSLDFYEVSEDATFICSREEVKSAPWNSILLIDMVEESPPLFPLFQSVMFSSPSRARQGEFVKDFAVSFVLNPLSLEDLHKMRSFNVRLSKLCSPELLDFNYCIVGGLPRNVFSSTAECTNFIVNAALTKTDLETAATLLRNPSSTGLDVYDPAYKLVHMTSKTNLMVNRAFVISSPFAAECIAKFIDITFILSSMKSLGNTSNSSHRGKVFELFVHLMFQQKIAFSAFPLKPTDGPSASLFTAYKVHNVRRLPPKPARKKSAKVSVITQNSDVSSTEDDIVEAIQSIAPIDFMNFQTLDDISAVQKNVYYQPSSKTFKSVDSFMMVEDDLVLAFQVTIADSHDINASGLMALVDCIRKKLDTQRIANQEGNRNENGGKVRFHLVFICLAGSTNARNFTKQTIDFTEGSSMDRDKIGFMDEQQSIMEIYTGWDINVIELEDKLRNMK